LNINDETRDHLDELWETDSLKDIEVYKSIHSKCGILGKKLTNFIKKFEK